MPEPITGLVGPASAANAERGRRSNGQDSLENAWLRLMVDGIDDLVVATDTQNTIVQVNRRAESFFRTSAGDSEHKRHTVEMNRALFLDALFSRRTKEDGQPAGPALVTLVDPISGAELAFETRSSPVRHKRLGISGTAWILRNIAAATRDVASQRELERRRVEQALFKSEKLAATGRLAASIAHEINNPLEAIMNSLYILVNRISPDDPNFRVLEIAKKETERVSRILRQMLGFYRPVAGMTPTDVNALIEEAEQLVEKYLRQRGVRLCNEFGTDIPLVVASGDQIKQVLLNLLLNAQQAMPDGGEIFVSTHASLGAEPDFLRADAVHIRIRDTGAGIAEEHVAHIFEPFFSTKEEKGTGLGLWVSDGIVRSHGGHIGVRSHAGHGTTFTVSLPIGGPPLNGQG